MNCKNKELNAKLYSNRAAAHYSLGKSSISSISFPGFSPTRPTERDRERRVSLPQHRGKMSTHAPAFPVSFLVTLSSQINCLPCALGFILCAAHGSVVLIHAARVFDYFVVIEIAFMDNQAQITETIN